MVVLLGSLILILILILLLTPVVVLLGSLILILILGLSRLAQNRDRRRLRVPRCDKRVLPRPSPALTITHELTVHKRVALSAMELSRRGRHRVGVHVKVLRIESRCPSARRAQSTEDPLDALPTKSFVQINARAGRRSRLRELLAQHRHRAHPRPRRPIVRRRRRRHADRERADGGHGDDRGDRREAPRRRGVLAHRPPVAAVACAGRRGCSPRIVLNGVVARTRGLCVTHSRILHRRSPSDARRYEAPQCSTRPRARWRPDATATTTARRAMRFGDDCSRRGDGRARDAGRRRAT